MEKVCQLLFLNTLHKYSRDISKANSRNYCLPASIFLFFFLVIGSYTHTVFIRAYGNPARDYISHHPC